MSGRSSTGSQPTPGFDLDSHCVVVPSHEALSPLRLANVWSVTMSVSDSASAGAVVDAEVACGSVECQHIYILLVASCNSTFDSYANVDLGLDMNTLDRNRSRFGDLCSDCFCLGIGLLDDILDGFGSDHKLRLGHWTLHPRSCHGQRRRCVATPLEDDLVAGATRGFRQGWRGASNRHLGHGSGVVRWQSG